MSPQNENEKDGEVSSMKHHSKTALHFFKLQINIQKDIKGQCSLSNIFTL